MIKNLFRIKSGELILAHPHPKLKPLKKFYLLISENYKKLNSYFGIEDKISNQILFYGLFIVSTFMLLVTHLIAGFLYGF
ncbi:hypothetical protein BK741_11935 [Bacillus thuringiensis serovar iberica]|uniref:DUF3961 domain-containing protein n=1 Tax=Bacillus thuringiensis serovar iberica TaxID=180866 RepID=A0A9X6LQF0_BACTU|nr:hypothetical protein BK741_11935 [Bacillus thuringiensis serovar iberica]